MRKFLTKQEQEFLDNPEAARRKYQEAIRFLQDAETEMRKDPDISRQLDLLCERARFNARKRDRGQT